MVSPGRLSDPLMSPGGLTWSTDVSPGSCDMVMDWLIHWAVSATYHPQLYGCSRQCSCPVLAWCSMGFGPNQLINGLIQHTFKLNIFFFSKIHSNTFWLDKTFIFSSQVTMMFQKKRCFENKKIRVRFSNVDFPAKPAKQKKQVALKKSLRVHTRGAPAAAAERVY